MIQTYLGDQKRLMNYMEFLKDFAKLTYEPVTEMFPIYIEKAMTYFHISDSRLRANAVYLITALLVEGSHRDDLTFRQDTKPLKITSVKIASQKMPKFGSNNDFKGKFVHFFPTK